MNTNSPKVIFITGTNSAGKGTVVEYLKEQGYLHASVSAFLEKVANEKGIPITPRLNLKDLGNDLRRTHGPAYLIETLYDDSLLSLKNVVIESVRTTGEVEFIKSKPGIFFLLAVDAEPKIRYERARLRGREIDKNVKSFEQFIAEEEAESKGTDHYVQNLPACIKAADCIVYNDGSVNELCYQVNDFIRKISEVEEKV